MLVDATFHRRDARDLFLRELGADADRVLFIECTAPEEVLIARARARESDPDRISDAGPEIVRRQLQERQPLVEITPAGRAALETVGGPEEALGRVGKAADESVFGARG